MHGDAGVPLHATAGGPPPTAVAQIGQGCVGTPVRMVREFSWKLSVAEPSLRSSVPLAGAENVFSTQTERPAFEIGSGVPKRQPVLEQSNPAPAVGNPPTVH